MKLLRTATIRGHVLDSEGKARRDVFVELLSLTYDGLGHPVWFPLRSGTTNSEGEYRLPLLTRGKYYLRTSPRRPPQGTGNAATYFPGTSDGAAAAALVVDEGDEIVADIRERVSETYSLSGQVMRSLPESAAKARVLLRITQRNSAAPRDQFGATQTSLPESSDGRFEITGVAPGTYDLRAVATVDRSGENPGATYLSESVVQVRDRDVDGVRLTLQSGVTISGRLVIEGDGQGIGFPTPARSRPEPVDLEEAITPRPQAPEKPPNFLLVNLNRKDGLSLPLFTSTENPDGASFKIANVPQGEYVISASQSSTPPFSSYVADIRSGARSVFDEGIVVGNSPVALDFIVRSNGGTIQGTVTGLGKEPVSVVLVPAQHRQNPTLYARLELAPESRNFTLHGVAPGNYNLFAWEGIPRVSFGTARPYMNSEFIAAYEGRGVSVIVEANATVSGLRIPIVPLGQ